MFVDNGNAPKRVYDENSEVSSGEHRQPPAACPITDSELVERAVRNAKNTHPCPTMPRWHAVSRVFGCGKTVAWELCERYGLTPDDEIRSVLDRE